MEGLPPEAMAQVAAYFQALSEPTRLQILNLLRQQERSVGELAQLCGFSSANVSRHLSLLSQHGLVQREPRGNSAIYRIADPAVYQLCDLVCGSLARRWDVAARQHAAFSASTTVAGDRSGPVLPAPPAPPAQPGDGAPPTARRQPTGSPAR